MPCSFTSAKTPTTKKQADKTKAGYPTITSSHDGKPAICRLFNFRPIQLQPVFREKVAQAGDFEGRCGSFEAKLDQGQNGDILITVKGSGLGEVNILNIERVAISRQLMAIRVRGVLPELPYAFLLAPAQRTLPRGQYKNDDLLDAFAALWTAERIYQGKATELPDNPPTDAFGLKMAIVA